MLWAAVLVAALALSALMIVPKPAAAVGTAADAICKASRCVPGGDPKKDPPCATVKCGDSTNGFATGGVCVNSVPGVCKATSAQGQNGGMGDIKQALDAIKSILDMMKGQQGGGGSGSGSGAANPATTPGLGGCAQYYNVTTPSSDPCAVYVPPVSDSLGSSTGSAANDLISSLLGGAFGSSGGSGNGSNSAGGSSSGGSSGSNPQSGGAGEGSGQQGGNNYNGGVLSAVPGVSGDIQYSSSSVTVLVNNVDSKTGTQVAGFYGTGANGQPTTVIGGMCQSRPWSSNFLSFIIPASFFDSLCELRGYKVGTPVAAAPPTHTSSAPKVTKPAATTTPPVATSTGPYVEPQADIWAVPANVPLGARTTVFWNAKGVTSCQETSPDGSFSQNSLSGGAATVPLAGATTYTISCLTPAGDHITNYVTVNLSAN